MELPDPSHYIPYFNLILNETAKSQSRVIEYFIFFHMSNLNGFPVGSVRLVILWKNEKNNKVKYKDLKYAYEKISTKKVEYGWLLN